MYTFRTFVDEYPCNLVVITSNFFLLLMSPFSNILVFLRSVKLSWYINEGKYWLHAGARVFSCLLKSLFAKETNA